MSAGNVCLTRYDGFKQNGNIVKYASPSGRPDSERREWASICGNVFARKRKVTNIGYKYWLCQNADDYIAMTIDSTKTMKE